jgi:GTPase
MVLRPRGRGRVGHRRLLFAPPQARGDFGRHGPVAFHLCYTMTRAGIVTVAGKPNAGKSTLLNRLVGQKLSIVSPKPQSTRDRIVGIRTENDVQMIVLDTPGLLNPSYPLQHAMRAAAHIALADADVIVYLADAQAGAPPSLAEAAGLTRPPKAPILLALNKTDTLSVAQRDQLAQTHPDALFLSAITGEGIDTLLGRVTELLPESPYLYPDDEVSTQTIRFFVSELIRETALDLLEDEVPYSVACEVEEFREERTPVYIRAVLYVERESQKRILIGAKGSRIRQIGGVARLKIEELVDAQIYLDLWVKVLPNWRKNAAAMRRFGYQLPQSRSS